MKMFFLLVGVMLFFPYAEAQEKMDSSGLIVKKYIVRNFPAIRTLDVQYEQNMPAAYKLKEKGNCFEKGELRHGSKVKISATYPLYKAKQWAVYGNFRYNYYYFSTDRPGYPQTRVSPLFPKPDSDYHYWEISSNITYRSQLFRKPLFCTLNVAGSGSEYGFEKMRGIGIATVILKRTPSTVWSVGLIVLVNTGAVFPVFPVFSYWHKFASSVWTLDIGGPGYVYFRRPLMKNDRLSLGFSVNNEHFYLHTTFPSLPRHCYFNKKELRTEVLYEYLWDKHFCLTFRTGMLTFFRNRLSGRNRLNRTPYLSYTQHPTVFFNLGISYVLSRP